MCDRLDVMRPDLLEIHGMLEPYKAQASRLLSEVGSQRLIAFVDESNTVVEDISEHLHNMVWQSDTALKPRGLHCDRPTPRLVSHPQRPLSP